MFSNPAILQSLLNISHLTPPTLHTKQKAVTATELAVDLLIQQHRSEMVSEWQNSPLNQCGYMGYMHITWCTWDRNVVSVINADFWSKCAGYQFLK